VAVAAALAGAAMWSSVGNASPAAVKSAAHNDHDDHGHHEQNEDGIKFGPAPAVFPAGAEMAVLQGDPGVAGAIFTVRLRFPDGYVLPAHFHPTDEHVTVISGKFLVGIGDKFDKHALRWFHHRTGQRQPLRDGERPNRRAGTRHRTVRDDLRQPGRRPQKPQLTLDDTTGRARRR
jgi:quercetin dioxygenase-like cupin family protein